MRTINKVAVIGSGIMGSGIASLIAAGGAEVYLFDIVLPTDQDKLRNDPNYRNKLALQGLKNIANPKMGMYYSKQILDHVHARNLEDHLADLQNCDWIIEVVVEQLAIKKQIMDLLVKHSRADAIISSNTSGISITEMIADTPVSFRRRFLGTHFFNPPRYMKLLELIPTSETDLEIVEAMTEYFTKTLGKEVVLAKDTPNFIANRIGVFAYLDVMRKMETFGFDIPTTDVLTGPVIGRPRSATFKTSDLVGLDIADHVAQNVIDHVDTQAQKDAYRVPDFMKQLIAKKHLGNKTKAGFYAKKVGEDKKSVPLVWDLEQQDYVPFTIPKIELVQNALRSENKYQAITSGDTAMQRFVWTVLKDTLLYAASLVPEIADDPQTIDRAMRYGFNWELGPFEIWSKLGLSESVARMQAEGDQVPAWICDLVAQHATEVYPANKESTGMLAEESAQLLKANEGARLWDIGSSVLCLEFIGKGNVINEPVMDMMQMALDVLTSTDAKGLVITNDGKNFSNGADLSVIGQLALAGSYDALDQLIHKFQALNMGLRFVDKPVVAAPFGMTLGGGLEVVLHADRIVAATDSYMGLVEVGVGLVPGGGGNLERSR